MAEKRRIETAQARPDRGEVSHRWRIHPTVDKEMDELGDEDAVSVHAQMEIVRQDGLRAARHLVEDIYEVEAHGVDNSYRLSSRQKAARAESCWRWYCTRSTPRRTRNT